MNDTFGNILLIFAYKFTIVIDYCLHATFLLPTMPTLTLSFMGSPVNLTWAAF